MEENLSILNSLMNDISALASNRWTGRKDLIKGMSLSGFSGKFSLTNNSRDRFRFSGLRLSPRVAAKGSVASSSRANSLKWVAQLPRQ